MVASLISVFSARCAQPTSSATRLRRSPCAGKDLRLVVQAGRRHVLGRHVQHRLQAPVGHQLAEGPRQSGTEKRQPEPPRIGQDARQKPAQRPVAQRAAIGLFDIFPRVIDQMHVMHPRGTGRHAAEAAQAAVDMADGFRIGHALVFQHVLDQIDAPTGAVEFIAQRDIGRAGRGAEPAMHAAAQDLIGAGGAGIGKLFGAEIRLHLRPPSDRGSGCPPDRTSAAAPGQRGDRGACGGNAGPFSPPRRISVAWGARAQPPRSAPRPAIPDQPAAPVQRRLRLRSSSAATMRAARRHGLTSSRQSGAGLPCEMRHITQIAPQRDRGGRVHLFDHAPRHQGQQPVAAIGSAAPSPAPRSAAMRCPEMPRRARDLEGRRQRLAQGGPPRRR